jgi:hypothetical protein
MNLTPDTLHAVEPRLRGVLAATYALLSGWRDSHGAPLRTPPPSLAALAAELRAVAAVLDNPSFPAAANPAPTPDTVAGSGGGGRWPLNCTALRTCWKAGDTTMLRHRVRSDALAGHCRAGTWHSREPSKPVLAWWVPQDPENGTSDELWPPWPNCRGKPSPVGQNGHNLGNRLHRGIGALAACCRRRNGHAGNALFWAECL